ncbi:MAG: hypothetical protein ACM3W4_06170 [Ignavibacteriales bacterium]
MRDFLKGLGAISFFIVVAGVALAFMKPAASPPRVESKPSAREVAEASWTAQRDKLRSECMGANADALPPAVFKQLLDSCDQQAADQIGPREYWVSEEEKLQAFEAQRRSYSASPSTAAGVPPHTDFSQR